MLVNINKQILIYNFFKFVPNTYSPVIFYSMVIVPKHYILHKNIIPYFYFYRPILIFPRQNYQGSPLT